MVVPVISLVVNVMFEFHMALGKFEENLAIPIIGIAFFATDIKSVTVAIILQS